MRDWIAPIGILNLHERFQLASTMTVADAVNWPNFIYPLPIEQSGAALREYKHPSRD